MARAANVAEEGETNCFEFLRREGGDCCCKEYCIETNIGLGSKAQDLANPHQSLDITDSLQIIATTMHMLRRNLNPR